MRRISSGWTFFYKRVFPAIWFGFILVFLAINLFVMRPSEPSQSLPFLAVPILLLGFGYLLMKKLVFDMVDEVWDDGDALVVKNSGQEERVALADIKNVNYMSLTSPPRVTLSLRRPSVFGDTVTFCPPVRIVPFATSPVIKDLIDRIDAARQRRA